MTPTQLADLVERQLDSLRRNFGQQPTRPATANDLLSLLGPLLSNLCEAVKALDTGKAHHHG